MQEGLIAIPDEMEIPSELRPVRETRDSTVIRPVLQKVPLQNIPRACNWRVIVQPPKMPDTTEGGIAITPRTISGLRELANTGVVLAIGPLAWCENRGFEPGFRDFEVGDWVQFNENAGIKTHIEDENGDLVLIRVLLEVEVASVVRDPSKFKVVIR